ncbi:Asr1405/Asl0597 family protein [Geitlerinema sp. PCC 7407]|uniref:Asr1405/Asl0597 family protein n=1 Tax=Geitlerinema sp. PCC 7407 TaxID=1173025 RepID=UPI00029FF43C|nr:Asr1405/Asl0597 family protein [Geitlerinema sp. PCC 7407]AFY67190.1 hypothetical protein GEI7407_2717 [Geitlerinema sp. PCC 7407]
MNPHNPQQDLETGNIVNVDWEIRWQVYYRLRDLGISCCCLPNQPLRVWINGPTEAVQLESVVRQMTTPRSSLAQWLERCWSTES